MGKQLHLLNQNQLLEAIKTNDSEVLKYIYIDTYPKVEALIHKNSGSMAHVKDTYQDAFLTVCTHVKNGKFVSENNASLQDYLYRVSKHKWDDVLRSNTSKDSSMSNKENGYDEAEDNNIRSTMEAFRNLELPCKQLLKLLYFEKKSLKEVAAVLKIEGSAVKNKKIKCIRKLREMTLASK
ncbi:hypothetical protein MHTCC0001_14970 [Flavobacteriaceae bacterium MHTCC 0001]